MNPLFDIGGYGNLANYGASSGFMAGNPVMGNGQLGSGTGGFGAPATSFISQPDLIGFGSVGAPTAVAGATGGSGMWGGLNNWLFGSQDTATGVKTNGAAGALLGLGQGLFNAYGASEQLKLGRAQYETMKQYAALNANNMAKTVNAQMEDRQRARVASNPGAYQSVGDYMNNNRVSGIA